MNLAKKISQIKHLEEIKPDKKWEKTIKYNLLEEITAQNRLRQAYKLSAAQKVDLFAMRVFNRLAPSMTKVLASFLILMMFFGVNMAAQASVPGETLWPIKRSIEEAELSITFSPVKKTEVYIKHVNERIAEIDKILEEPLKPEEPEVKIAKEKAIKQAVTHLEKDVISVDSSLKIVKQEKNAIEVVELVKKVTDATKEVETNLEAQKKKVAADDATDEILGQILDNAQSINQQVKKSAVSVAIEVHEEVQKSVENQSGLLAINPSRTTSTPNQGLATDNTGSFDTTTVDILVKSETSQENIVFNTQEAETISNLVREIVASEINQVSLEVQGVKEKVDAALDADIANIKKDVLAGDQETTVGTVELDEIDVIKNESNEDREGVLEEVKVLLDNGMLKDAFEKVNQLQDKYNKAEVTLEKIEKVIEKSAGEKSGEVIHTTTSTSSPIINIKPEEANTIEASGIDIEESDIKIKEEEQILSN